MSDVVVTGLGLLTPVGHGRDSLVSAWRAGTSSDRVPLGPLPRAALCADFPLKDMFPEHRPLLRRADRLSRMIAGAAGLCALDGVGLGAREGHALAVGTDLGTLEETWLFLNRLREKGPELANPNDFPNLVPNAGAGYVGIVLGLRGPSMTFCQHETCGDDAVNWVAEGIATGEWQAGLGGGAEELGPIRAQASMRSCRTEGAVPGEGAAMLALESRARANARGANPLATWLGHWEGTAPSRGSALRRKVDDDAVSDCVRDALRSAGASAVDVGAVLAGDGAAAGARGALPGAPLWDGCERLGVHPADGALRCAVASLLLADSTWPVHAGGPGCDRPLAVVVTAARGGGVRTTVFGRA